MNTRKLRILGSAVNDSSSLEREERGKGKWRREKREDRKKDKQKDT